MPKRKKGQNKASRQTSCYKLSEVVQKIDHGEWLINDNASRDALKDFGWERADIINAYRMLQPKHFYKTDESNFKPGVLIDVYKGQINREHIYTHFYIDDEFSRLIINSFKKDDDYS